MTDYLMVYITCRSEEEAESIAEKVVGQNLAACGNILPRIKSVFQWQGTLQNESEALLILKTTKKKKESLLETVTDLHSYDTPCILFYSVADGHPDYLKWIDDSTQTKAH